MKFDCAQINSRKPPLCTDKGRSLLNKSLRTRSWVKFCKCRRTMCVPVQKYQNKLCHVKMKIKDIFYSWFFSRSSLCDIHIKDNLFDNYCTGQTIPIAPPRTWGMIILVSDAQCFFGVWNLLTTQEIIQDTNRDIRYYEKWFNLWC